MTIIKRARVAATAVVVAGLLSAVGSSAALGAEVGFGSLFLNGHVVGTVVVFPAQLPPFGGVDPFYGVMGGATGQLGVAGVGPGSADYHGGDWAFNSVAWNTGKTPRLLTSAAAVLAARDAGEVTITRLPAKDFRCPITSTAVGG